MRAVRGGHGRGAGPASRIMPGRPSACPSGLAGGGPVRQLADTVGSHAFAAFCVASCFAVWLAVLPFEPVIVPLDEYWPGPLRVTLPDGVALRLSEPSANPCASRCRPRSSCRRCAGPSARSGRRPCRCWRTGRARQYASRDVECHPNLRRRDTRRHIWVDGPSFSTGSHPPGKPDTRMQTVSTSRKGSLQMATGPCMPEKNACPKRSCARPRVARLKQFSINHSNERRRNRTFSIAANPRRSYVSLPRAGLGESAWPPGVSELKQRWGPNGASHRLLTAQPLGH